MRYYEGIDYWVRRVEFPNAGSESVAVSNGDGTFTIYLNTLFSEERLADRLQHELQHLEDEHFYRDDLTINQIERQADGKRPVDIIEEAPAKTIPVFYSLDAFKKYVYSCREARS